MDKTARDILEEKDPKDLTDGQHQALATYYLADVLGEALIGDDEGEEEDEE